MAASFSKNSEDLAIGYSSTENIEPDRFVCNKEFMNLLNENLHDKVDQDFSFIVEAGANADTYMPIYDFREVPRFGRTPEVDSIFGYVRVGTDGKIVPKSFEANVMYRICNGAGLVTLSDYMLEQVRNAIRK